VILLHGIVLFNYIAASMLINLLLLFQFQTTSGADVKLRSVTLVQKVGVPIQKKSEVRLGPEGRGEGNGENYSSDSGGLGEHRELSQWCPELSPAENGFIVI